VTDELGAGISDLALGDILAEAAAGVVGLTVGTAPADDRSTASIAWSVGEVPFAILSGNRAEFRLDPVVVAAALRTPDTAPSSRGSDWVAFAPVVIDDHVVDRAEAWFLSAYRRASGPGSR
jgi:hypothetical protein